MSCPPDCFRPHPELRVRPVPELGYCLVFTPERPALYTLNAAAWLLFELCEGQDFETLQSDFVTAYAEQGIAAGEVPDVHAIVEDLARKGILLRQTKKEKVP